MKNLLAFGFLISLVIVDISGKLEFLLIIGLFLTSLVDLQPCSAIFVSPTTEPKITACK